MEKMKILTEEKIITLKTNLKTIQKTMSSNNDNSWINSFFKEEDPFIPSKISINKFDLKMNEENPIDSDLENAKIIFKHLKDLPLTIASNEQFWTSLAFGRYYDYMSYRWGVAEEDVGLRNLKYRWFFHVPGRRALVFNGLSKLWWFAKLTIREDLENPYEYMDYLSKRIKIYERLFYRSYSASDNIRYAVYRSIIDLENEGGKVSIEMVDSLYKYISFLGGAYLLDSFTENELYQRFYNKLIELYTQEDPSQKAFKL